VMLANDKDINDPGLLRQLRWPFRDWSST